VRPFVVCLQSAHSQTDLLEARGRPAAPLSAAAAPRVRAAPSSPHSRRLFPCRRRSGLCRPGHYHGWLGYQNRDNRGRPRHQSRYGRTAGGAIRTRPGGAARLPQRTATAMIFSATVIRVSLAAPLVLGCQLRRAAWRWHHDVPFGPGRRRGAVRPPRGGIGRDRRDQRKRRWTAATMAATTDAMASSRPTGRRAG